jgi:hypothetical protein
MRELDAEGPVAPLGVALPLTAGMPGRRNAAGYRQRRQQRGDARSRGQAPRPQEPRARRLACSFVLASVPGAKEVFAGAAHDWGNLLTDTVRRSSSWATAAEPASFARNLHSGEHAALLVQQRSLFLCPSAAGRPCCLG